MEIILWIILGIAVLVLIYLIYQIVRNDKVAEIRFGWIEKNDSRIDEYTYDEMFNSSFKNWLGLKYPNEKDFK